MATFTKDTCSSYVRANRLSFLIAAIVLVAISLFSWASPARATGYSGAIHSGYNSRCLDADLNTIGSNGTKVQLWDCNGQPQQKLTTSGDGAIHSGYNSRCLDADLNTIGSNGTKVQLWDCNGQPQQKWIISGDGTIRSSYNNRCLDADLNTIGSNGTKVQLWDCNGQPQQKWAFNGPAVDKCSPTNGVPHTYAIATRKVSSQGYDVEFHANYMTPGRSGPEYPAHISAETWVNMDNGSWVEVGIVNGYPAWADNKQGTPPLTAYSFFWADGYQGCQNMSYYWIHTIRNTVPDGTSHHFAITYRDHKQWNIWLDGQVVGISTITNSSHAINQQIGLELGEANGVCGDNSSANEFWMHPSTLKGTKWTAWPPESSVISQSPTFHTQWNYFNPFSFVVSKNRC